MSKSRVTKCRPDAGLVGAGTLTLCRGTGRDSSAPLCGGAPRTFVGEEPSAISRGEYRDQALGMRYPRGRSSTACDAEHRVWHDAERQRGDRDEAKPGLRRTVAARSGRPAAVVAWFVLRKPDLLTRGARVAGRGAHHPRGIADRVDSREPRPARDAPACAAPPSILDGGDEGEAESAEARRIRPDQPPRGAAARCRRASNLCARAMLTRRDSRSVRPPRSPPRGVSGSSAVASSRRGRPACRFDDPAVFQHPVERAVERAGLELQLAFGEDGDLLQQAVAVTLLFREGEEDVEFDRAQSHISVRRLYAPRIYVNVGLDEGTVRKVERLNSQVNAKALRTQS